MWVKNISPLPPNLQGGGGDGPLRGVYPIVGVYSWFLNIMSMSISIPIAVDIINKISNAWAKENLGGVIIFITFLLLEIFVVGVLVWTRWYLTLAAWIGTHLYNLGFSRKMQRWFLCNLCMNLSLIFINYKSFQQIMWASGGCLSVVATISLSHNRRDPTGLTEGFSTCFVILFLTHINSDDTTYHTVRIGVFCLVTGILCFLCSIDPAAEGLQNRVADLERELAALKVKVQNTRECGCLQNPLRAGDQRVQEVPESSIQMAQLKITERSPIVGASSSQGQGQLMGRTPVDDHRINVETLTNQQRLEKLQLELLELKQTSSFVPKVVEGSSCRIPEGVQVHSHQPCCSNLHGLDKSSTSYEHAEEVSLCHIQDMANTETAGKGVGTPDNLAFKDQSDLLDGSASGSKQAEDTDTATVMEMLPKDGSFVGWPPLKRSARIDKSATFTDPGKTVSASHIQQMANPEIEEKGVGTPDSLQYNDQTSFLDASASGSKQAEQTDAAAVKEMFPKGSSIKKKKSLMPWTPLRRSVRLMLKAAKKEE